MELKNILDTLKGDGTVALYDTVDGKKVICKRYDEYEDCGYDIYAREDMFLKELQEFDFIPRVLEVRQDLHEYTLIEEYIDGITIKEWLRKNPSKKDRLNVYLQILKAVQKIHSMNIVHADLKENNIILKDGKVYIIDFGVANYADTQVDYAASNYIACYDQAHIEYGSYIRKTVSFSWDNYQLGKLYKNIMGSSCNKIIANEFVNKNTYKIAEVRMDLEDMINTIENYYKI